MESLRYDGNLASANVTPLRIEGYTPRELLELPDETLTGVALSGEPLIFQAGSAQILGRFYVHDRRLTVELAQIEGGGEGALPALWLLTKRYAVRQQLEEVEWIVHAVHCARPNLKLRRVLERRGFVVRADLDCGEAYYFRNMIGRGKASATDMARTNAP